MKSIFYKLLMGWFYFPMRFFKGCKKKMVISMHFGIQFSKMLEKFSGNYISIRMRSKNVEIGFLENRLIDEKTAIVMQGPIIEKDNFTYITLKFYREIYPKAIIILSTWDTENKDIIQDISKLNVSVIQNEVPKNPGSYNINLQIITSQKGIELAKNKGAKFICKTRTDQRIYKSNFLCYFLNLLDLFPNNNNDFKVPQEKRIICFSMEYGNMFYPYLLSDFMFFGAVNDIEKLFDLELDRGEGRPSNTGLSRRTVANEMRAPEIKIIRSYAQKQGFVADVSIERYWQLVRNHFICMNKDQIGLFWFKYDMRHVENIRNGYYYFFSLLDEYPSINIDFEEWLEIYMGTRIYEKKYENYADIFIN